MQKLSRLVVAAATAAFFSLPSGVALAQGTPNTGTGTGTGATSSTTSSETATTEKAVSKKKKPAKMTRQQEIDRSVDRGTVPARYRSSVPKEYHQYIPFDKK